MNDMFKSPKNLIDTIKGLVGNVGKTQEELAQNFNAPVEGIQETKEYEIVDKALLSDNADILKYMVNMLNNNLGFIGKINISGQNKLTIEYNGYLNKGENADSILLKVLRDIKKAKLGEGFDFGYIYLDNFKIKIDTFSSNIRIHIEILGQPNKENLTQIKELYEKIIIPNITIENKTINNMDFLKEEFDISSKDSINIEEDKIEIIYLCDVKKNIDDKSLFLILNEYLPKGGYILNFDYSIINHTIKYGKGYEYGIISNNHGNYLNLNIDIDEKSGELKVIISKTKCTLNSKLIKNVLGPFLKYVKNEIQKGGENDIMQELKDMGIKVVEAKQENGTTLNDLYEKEGLIGYKDIKEKIEDTIINPWKNKEEYLRLANEHFSNIKDIIPNAVLFEGPAGTGKTTLARIIGKHLKYPFFYIPLNSFMSKWYGEAETKLSFIMESIGKIAESEGGAIVMFDEIDEIGGNRDKSHEATGKLTGVLLKKLDGMEKIENIILVGATNRKESLDPALISRFKHSQYFRLPNCEEIINIATHYIKELASLPKEKIQEFENLLSGREIKGICEQIARKSIKEKLKNNDIDLIDEFIKQCKYSIETK